MPKHFHRHLYVRKGEEMMFDTGVSVDEWNASDLPELLAAMERFFMEGVSW